MRFASNFVAIGLLSLTSSFDLRRVGSEMFLEPWGSILGYFRALRAPNLGPHILQGTGIYRTWGTAMAGLRARIMIPALKPENNCLSQKGSFGPK